MPRSRLRPAARPLRACLPLALVGYVLAGPGVLRAQPPDAENVRAAQAKAEDGARQLERGNPQRALELFREALASTGNARYQYNIGVACEAAGLEAEALEAFERFLAQADGVKREHRRDAEKKIEALRRKVAALQIYAPEPGVELFLDEVSLGTTPLRGPVRVNGGSHVLAGVKQGFKRFERRVTVAAGEQLNVGVTLEPLTAPPSLAPTIIDSNAAATAGPPAPRGRLWLWVGVAAVVAAGTVAGVLIATRGPGSPGCPGDAECLRR